MSISDSAEFLVTIDFTVPTDMGEPDLDALRRAEAQRASELSESGHLVRLWRIPGRWANWGLWRAANRTELDEILASLPLFPLATIAVYATETHPNDPLRGFFNQPPTNEGRQTWPQSQ
ncbi:muconolactone Delta-isomerase family protein [Rhodococcus sp. 114MFTsu3.1]|jgi:muconolactone delta-isomerase|uniref:muconolactone Delta-isomerase family protein n=1 Tax=Rhodococcus sp. 114MFTsu3.1 TaxID=1172184 RepID=UPI0003613754|nr:muconolactone Delta-isomerase family protein [Rhodococcus sp. 114MFTsu3.1]